jgi:hypothetical protein
MLQDDKIELNGDVQQLALYVGASAVFGAGVGAVMGIEPAEQFFAGYLLEQSLSIDNLFVFILVFRYIPLTQALQSLHPCRVCLTLSTTLKPTTRPARLNTYSAP